MAKPKHAPKSTLSDFAKCREFLERMCHHLAYTPDAGFRPRAYEAALAALSEHGSLEGLGAVKGIGKSMQAAFAEVVTNKDPKCLLEILSLIHI